MKFYFALVVLGLLSTGCAATLARPVPEPLPEVPSYELSPAPVPPTAPTMDLSSSLDAEWGASFRSDGEGSKKLLEGGALGVVFPKESELALRIGVLSAVLKHGRQVHDLGCISDIPGLQFGESVGNDTLHLSLIDPTASWVASTVAESLALEAVFRIHVLEVAPAEILGHKVAYRSAFEKYEARYRIYEKSFNKWSEEAKEGIESQKSKYEQSVQWRAEDFAANWREYANSLPVDHGQRKPVLTSQPYVAPSLPLIQKQSVEEPIPELSGQAAHLIGQVVSRSTGETICTVDITQRFPIESSKAQIVRTLVEKLP